MTENDKNDVEGKTMYVFEMKEISNLNENGGTLADALKEELAALEEHTDHFAVSSPEGIFSKYRIDSEDTLRYYIELRKCKDPDEASEVDVIEECWHERFGDLAEYELEITRDKFIILGPDGTVLLDSPLILHVKPNRLELETSSGIFRILEMRSERYMFDLLDNYNEISELIWKKVEPVSSAE